ncbi:MAG: type III pantothenate kinase [bacterium]
MTLMRVLVADIGNSQAKVVRCDLARMQSGAGLATSPQPLFTVETPADSAAGDNLARQLTAALDEQSAGAAVLVSVVPNVTRALTSAVPNMVAVDHTVPLPFSLAIEEPAAVGADRYCNLAAAVASGWPDALVVDLGTATTFDLLVAGEFVGGLIAPGMAFAAEQLGHLAARLQPVPFAPCPLEVGTSTAAAMRAGAYHVGIGGVATVTAALLERYGARPVMITGGLGEFLDSPEWRHDPDWTLRGAVELAIPLLREM